MHNRPHDTEQAPLKSAAFHILLALADGPLHGYAVRTAVQELTAGAVRLWPVTLYGTIRELTEQRLIEPAGEEAEDEEDARGRRSYRLTEAGRLALASETARLRALVEHAERTRALAQA